MYIYEELKTEVVKDYDVAVCGGGIAGIAAALAAAREGRRVLLLEKEFALGGLATLGLVTIYLPLCDGMGRQVSFGIAEELLRLSVSEGAEGELPTNWLSCDGKRGENEKRYMAQFNPHMLAMLAEELLRKSGVDIMYGTYAVGVKMRGDTVEYLITENKSGRQAYKVFSVVDASGDCDIAHFANAPTETFKQGNTLAAWYYYIGENGYALNTLGFCDVPDEDKTEDNSPTLLNMRRFGGLDGKELSELMQMSHSAVHRDITERRAKDATLIPVTVATVPQIRMTRRIVGEYELSHMEEGKYFDDSVGMVSNWKKRGPIYEVPYRTLYSGKVKNLICAGRCVSVGETMWDIMRVIPCCAVTGQAAGTAAAMTNDFPSLDVAALQARLRKGGAVLHINELNKVKEMS